MKSKTEERKDYVVVWERIANSGIWERKDTTLEEVKSFLYNPKFVKSTIIEGKIVEIVGKEN